MSDVVDAVLIDDDLLIHLTWKSVAKAAGKSLLCFASVDEFIKNTQNLPRDTVIYVDSNLGKGIKGEVAAEKISELGFAHICLATGYSADSFSKFPWIKQIVGKDPPWSL